jgi:hypothetical protein
MCKGSEIYVIDEFRPLTLAGLGVEDHTQPDKQFPDIVDGNHLRWTSIPTVGFPPFGYHLYRRKHIGNLIDDPPRIFGSDENDELPAIDSTLSLPYSIGNVRISGPERIRTVDNYDVGSGLQFAVGADQTPEFDIRDRDERVRVAFDFPVFEVTLLLAVGAEAAVTTALSDGTEVDSATMEETGHCTLSADRIDAVEIANGSTIVDILFYPIQAEHAASEWKLVHSEDKPIALPVTHDNYPAGQLAWGQSSQDLDGAREIADRRIEYGDPEDYTGQVSEVATRGTVEVENNSPIVLGSNTGWSSDVTGSIFQVDGESTAYVIVDALPGETTGDDDRLVLSRPYESPSKSDVKYTITDDTFGQLHDYLISLVSAPLRMGARALPLPITDEGTVEIETGETTVKGIGVNWLSRHEGLHFRVGDAGADTVSVTPGNRTVRRNVGSGSELDRLAWEDRLVGRTIRFNGQQERYTITAVTDATLTLDRPFVGLDAISEATYVVYEQTTYEIESVDTSANEVTLATPYRGRSLTKSLDRILPSLDPFITPTSSASSRRPYEITTEFTESTEDESATPASMPYQYPLELIQMASVNPAIAQALGLYYIDQDADPDVSYDYLLLADYSERLEPAKSPNIGVLDTLRFQSRTEERDGWGTTANPTSFGSTAESNFNISEPSLGVEGYITFDVQRGQAEPLSPPSNPEVYDIPEIRNEPGPNAAGLSWDLPTTSTGRLRPKAPVLYHLWRHEYESTDTEPADEALPLDRYDPLTAPPGSNNEGLQDLIIGSDPASRADEPSERPPDWPVQDIHTVDTAVPDGWYSYRVGGVDLFGRLSEPSSPASWWTWVDEFPLEEHPVAIHLEDARPPPPPRRVDATLEPETSSDAGNNGTATVTWRWPQRYVEQAPDAAGFHIHYRPGRLHDQVGTVIDVTDQGDERYTVRTDVEPLSPAGGYAGATLHVSDTTYEVTDSRATGNNDSQLELDVVNRQSEPIETVTTADGTDVTIDATDHRPHATRADVDFSLAGPQAGDDCTVSIPPAYKKGDVTVRHGDRIVHGHETAWSSHLEGREFTTPDGEAYIVETVEDDAKLHLNREYQIPDEQQRFDTPRIWDIVDPDGYDSIGDGQKQGATRRTSYTIEHPIRTDFSQSDAWDAPNTPSNWQTTDGTVPFDTGTLIRDEEDPSDEDPEFADGDPYRQYEVEVAVPGTGEPETDPFVPNATDPVAHAHFAVSTFDDNDNEGRVSTPVQVARAKSDPPATSEPPEFENEIDWATPPDYDGLSRYTVRWKHPGDNLQTHVYRTMDKALFKHDWNRRTEGASQDVTPDEGALFPPYRRGSGPPAERRDQIVTMLDDLHASVTGESDFQAAFEYYRDLDPDVQQVIAAIPENEAAYAQQTVEPLDPDKNAGTEGPDVKEGDPTSDEWCGWVDEFDGRSRRRYFYRTVNVDTAHNRSVEMSYPSQPVQAEDIVPPTTPSPSGIEAGHHDETQKDDRAITLKWEPSPERDTSGYRVYHTVDRESSRDVRLMEPVATEPHPDRGPVEWSDTGRRADVTHYYRITAVDEAGNESDASSVLAGETFVLTPPEPPELTLEWVLVDANGGTHPSSASSPQGETWWPAVKVSWSSSDPPLRSLVQHRAGSDESFEGVGGWLEPGTTEYVHEVSNDAIEHAFRLRVQNDVGATNETHKPATLAARRD